jgi:AcrR family transcriptional regulator
MTYYCVMTTRRAARPRGRPSLDAGPVLRRDDLLVAAARHFAQGYAATSVRAIARELDVSQAAVQHHAATKDALFAAVIDEVIVPRLVQARNLAASMADPSVDTAPQVTALVRSRMDALVAHGGFVVGVMSDNSPGAGHRRELLLAAIAPERQAALRALSGLAERGVTRKVSDTVWSVLSIAAIPAIAQAWPTLERLDPALVVDRAAVLDEIADLLVRGLLPR